MLVVDFAPILKAWAYYMHHTLDTNQSGSDLIGERALALYFILKNKLVNIGRIITGDIDDIVKSHKKALGHATMIHLLCQKAGVEDLDGRQMLRPPRCLDPSWSKEKTVAITSEEQRPPRRTYASGAGTSEPPRQATSPGVLRASPYVEDEDSQAHIDRMTQFCFVQDMCAHMGAFGLYLTH